MTHSCLRLSWYRSIRIPARIWLGPILVTGSLYLMPAHAQDEPNAQPAPTTTTTTAGQGIRPNKVDTPYRRFDNAPSWSSPHEFGDSMWGTAMDPPSRKETRWYGWQQMIPLLSADIAFVASWASGDLDAVRATLVWGPAAHLLTGPIVHWAHGHFDKSLAAFGLNLFIPGMTFLLLAATLDTGIYNGSFGFPLMVGVAGSGFLAAQAIDIAYLSKETVYVPIGSARQTRSWLPTSVAVLPMIDSNVNGLMLTGQF